MLVTEADLAARSLRAGGLVGRRLVRVVELAADPAELAYAGGGVMGGGAEHPVVHANLGSRDDRLGQFRLHPYVSITCRLKSPATRPPEWGERCAAAARRAQHYSIQRRRAEARWWLQAESGLPAPHLWPQDVRDTRYVVP
jgi:hypothetical protein